MFTSSLYQALAWSVACVAIGFPLLSTLLDIKEPYGPQARVIQHAMFRLPRGQTSLYITQEDEDELNQGAITGTIDNNHTNNNEDSRYKHVSREVCKQAFFSDGVEVVQKKNWLTETIGQVLPNKFFGGWNGNRNLEPTLKALYEGKKAGEKNNKTKKKIKNVDNFGKKSKTPYCTWRLALPHPISTNPCKLYLISRFHVTLYVHPIHNAMRYDSFKFHSPYCTIRDGAGP